MSQPEKPVAPKPSPLLTFVRDKIIPFNALVTMYFTIAGVIDFFLKGAPQVLFGIAIILALAFVGFCYAQRANAGKLPRAIASFLGLSDSGGGKRRIATTGVYLGIGILIFSGAAVASNAKKDKGGALAALIPYLADVQAQLHHVEASNEKIVATLENVKRETSSDPRKELANQGVMWDHRQFQNAVQASDIRTLDLFLQGGMQIRGADIQTAVTVQNDKLLDLFAAHADSFFKPDCREMLIYSPGVRLENTEDSLSKFAKAACRSQAVRKDVDGLLAFAKSQAKLGQGTAEKNAEWRRSPAKCVEDELNGDGPPVSAVTDDYILGLKRSGMMEEAKAKAAELCKFYLNKAAAGPGDDPEVKKWTSVAKLLS